MDVFVARQPVFNRSEKVFGYELRFRAGLDSYFQPETPDEGAAKALADAFFVFGVDAVARGKRALLPFNREALVGHYATLLPKDALVVAVHESVQPDQEVLRALIELKQAGYLLALDGLALLGKPDAFIRLADLIRADFARLNSRSRILLSNVFTPMQIRLVAVNVATKEDFAEAMRAGYSFLQGDFFCQPVILASGEVPSSQLTAMQVLREINRTPMNIGKVDELIRNDVALTYKLLRYINSPWFGLRHKIGTIRQAILLLGEVGTRKWASVAVMSGMAEGKPVELVALSIVRARFCELLAEHVDLRQRQDDLFLIGLFSLIDTLLGRPMKQVLADLPIGDDLSGTLLGFETPLSPTYQFVLAYERGNWERVNRLAGQLGLDEAKVPELYRKAVESGTDAAQGEG